jgi:hypothetical protein
VEIIDLDITNNNDEIIDVASIMKANTLPTVIGVVLHRTICSKRSFCQTCKNAFVAPAAFSDSHNLMKFQEVPELQALTKNHLEKNGTEYELFRSQVMNSFRASRRK